MKMKKYIVSTCALAFMLSSCNILDKEPLDQLSPDSFFRTELECDLFTRTFYNNLLDKSPFDNQSDHFVNQTLSAEIIGGDRRTPPASGGGWTWTDLRKMNTFLEYAPKQCEDPAVLEEYSALVRFFRAYFYFDKVKRFGDVPWYDRQLYSGDPDLYKARDPREYILTKMIEDIDYAITYLPETSSTPFRVNKWAALALKAQFCLFEGTFRKYHGLSLEGNDWQYYLDLAAKAAEELIDKGPYVLYSTGKPDQDYHNLFVAEDANASEYILAIKFDFALQIFHNAAAYCIQPSQQRPGMTKKMVDSYLKDDGSRFTDNPDYKTMMFVDEMKDRDPRLAQTIRSVGYQRTMSNGSKQSFIPDFQASSTGYQPIKFVQDQTCASGSAVDNGKSTNDIPVYRLAGVMLDFAEAKAELGTLTQEDLEKSVNKIRERAGMPDLELDEANGDPDPYLSSADFGYPNVTGSNKGVILEIRRERAVELAQEGYRYFDLIRWKAGPCIDQAIYGMYFPAPGLYDLSGDGEADICIFNDDFLKPNTWKGPAFKLGEQMWLSDGDKGYVHYHHNITHHFDEARDYYYPIPINDRTLNKNLTQNPGWNDGLNY